MSEDCPVCRGSGRIISKDTLITRIDHWLKRYKTKHRKIRLKLIMHPDNTEYLNKQKKKALRGLMWQNFVHIRIESDPTITLDDFRFITVKDGVDVTEHEL